MAIIGATIMAVFVCKLIKKDGRNMEIDDWFSCVLVSALGVLAGSHLLYGITNISYWGALKEATWDNLWPVIKVIFGGSVFYGGLIVGLITYYIMLKHKRFRGQRLETESVRYYLNLAGIGIPLFHGFARIGCFLGGCCYGIDNFPVQLLESAVEFGLFFLMFVLYRKGKKYILECYLMLYAVARFFIEFLRGDQIRGFVGVLSTSQFISVIVLAVCGFILFREVHMEKNKQ
ncbi:MAG: prolipoprotein diacylglyceryl transferase [Clostridia bacterium]|nr:prolipoprotein diacylglyceryl transferase [Clostridia bacterium]